VESNSLDDSDDDDDGTTRTERSEQSLAITEDEDIIAESDDYQQLVDKVRTVVEIFKRSPTKNDAVLQKYVIMELGHELHLALDCKTRWSSLWKMLDVFYRLRNPIQKACIDDKSSVILADADFESICEIIAALEPVKLSVKALSRRETSLVSADAAMHFCIVELEKQSSELGKTLEHHTDLSGLLQYLCDPKAATVDETF